jgi:hypothetical protein
MRHVDPLLAKDREKATIQQPLLSNSSANKHVYTATIGNSNRGIAFSVRVVPRCYNSYSRKMQ